MKKTTIVLLAAWLCTLAFPALGAKYTLSGYPIPMMIVDENNGLFVEVVKELIKRTGEDVAIVVNPPPRTVSEFAEGTIDGFFPALDVLIAKDKAETEEPMYFKEDYAFTREGTPAITTVAELEGKTVGITAGYPYAKEVTGNAKITFEEAQDDVANIQKLAAERIDVFVVEEKTGLKALQESGVQGITYAKGSPLSRQKVYIAFQPTDDGKRLAAAFSKALQEMKADGTFDRIMAPAK